MKKDCVSHLFYLIKIKKLRKSKCFDVSQLQSGVITVSGGKKASIKTNFHFCKLSFYCIVAFRS